MYPDAQPSRLFQIVGDHNGRGEVRLTDEEGTGVMEIAAPMIANACAGV